MPKSNFNQFLDEYEDVKTSGKTSISKISFEVESLPCNDECESETNQINKSHGDNHNSRNSDHNCVKTLNTFSSNSNSNARFGSGSSSNSNIFLSKSANNTRDGDDRFDRFSTNRMNNYTNTNHPTFTTNVQTNIFKKTDDGTTHLRTSTLSMPAPSTSTCIEINNETFPSLSSSGAAIAATTTTSSTITKKFKNFKDAICASAPAVPVVLSTSPTKQKQTRVLPSSAIHLPLVVKRDSEMYAKKMLAKTKNISAVYHDDDEDDDDDNREFSCNRNSKPMFNYENDSD